MNNFIHFWHLCEHIGNFAIGSFTKRIFSHLCIWIYTHLYFLHVDGNCKILFSVSSFDFWQRLVEQCMTSNNFSKLISKWHRLCFMEAFAIYPLRKCFMSCNSTDQLLAGCLPSNPLYLSNEKPQKEIWMKRTIVSNTCSQLRSGNACACLELQTWNQQCYSSDDKIELAVDLQHFQWQSSYTVFDKPRQSASTLHVVVSNQPMQTKNREIQCPVHPLLSCECWAESMLEGSWPMSVVCLMLHRHSFQVLLR